MHKTYPSRPIQLIVGFPPGGLCCGYEDLNDHDTLRDDLLMQIAMGRVDALASSPTLSRLKTRAN